jgi:hypothetical protein
MALTVSSDYYFYNLGYLFWSQTSRYGLTPIQNVGAAYGLDSTPTSTCPTRSRAASTRRRCVSCCTESPSDFPTVSWYTGDNIEMAFGQGATAVTPDRVGQRLRHLRQRRHTLRPRSRRPSSTRTARSLSATDRGCSATSPAARGAQPDTPGLTGVVESPSGTAYSAFHGIVNFSLAAFPIAGKTGTASNAGRRTSRTRGSWALDRPRIRSTWCCASWPRVVTGRTRRRRSWRRPSTISWPTRSAGHPQAAADGADARTKATTSTTTTTTLSHDEPEIAGPMASNLDVVGRRCAKCTVRVRTQQKSSVSHSASGSIEDATWYTL